MAVRAAPVPGTWRSIRRLEREAVGGCGGRGGRAAGLLRTRAGGGGAVSKNSVFELMHRMATQERLRRMTEEDEELKGKLATRRRAADRAELAAMAAEKVSRGRPVSRPEAAAYLGVSTKKLQRMEAAGQLRRCPGLGGVVRYAARDVLRLASA